MLSLPPMDVTSVKPPVTTGSSVAPAEVDTFPIQNELLSLSRATIQPLLKGETFTLLAADLIRTLERRCDGWHLPGDKEKKTHLVKTVVPVNWEELEKIQGNRSVTLDDIQKHRLTKVELPGIFATAVQQYLTSHMAMTRREFLKFSLAWIKQTLAESIELSDRQYYVANTRMEISRSDKQGTTDQKQIADFYKKRDEDVRSLTNKAFSASETAGIALGSLCRSVDYQGDLRERAAAIRHFFDWQNTIATYGMSVFVTAYFQSQKRVFENGIPERSFHRALYSPTGRMYDLVQRHLPPGIDLSEQEFTIENIRHQFEQTKKTRRTVAYVDKRFVKPEEHLPFLVLTGTKLESHYLTLTLNDRMDTVSKPHGAELSSDITGKKRAALIAEVQNGTHSFLTTTGVENIPTESFDPEKPVTVIVAEHGRKRLTHYPVIRNLLEAGIPVHIASFMTKSSTDTNIRRFVSRLAAPRKNNTYYDSGRVGSLSQLEFFDSLVSDQEPETRRTPKQVQILMGIFQSCEKLRRDIFTTKTMSARTIAEFEERFGEMLAVAERYLRAPEVRAKFERDLTSLLQREMRVAREQFLIQPDPSVTDIKNYAQYFKVLSILLNGSERDRNKLGPRTAASALAREFESVEEQLPESEQGSVESVFGVGKLRKFMANRAKRAITVAEEESELPYPGALSPLQRALAELSKEL